MATSVQKLMPKMNAIVETAPQLLDAVHFDAERLFAELADPTSLWYEMRVTKMASTDYLFIPRYICNAFKDSYPITEFIASLEAVSSNQMTKANIFAYSSINNDQYSFAKVDIEWHDGIANNWHLNNIPPSNKAYEFTQTVFVCSEHLVIPPKN